MAGADGFVDLGELEVRQEEGRSCLVSEEEWPDVAWGRTACEPAYHGARVPSASERAQVVAAVDHEAQGQPREASSKPSKMGSHDIEGSDLLALLDASGTQGGPQQGCAVFETQHNAESDCQGTERPPTAGAPAQSATTPSCLRSSAVSTTAGIAAEAKRAASTQDESVEPGQLCDTSWPLEALLPAADCEAAFDTVPVDFISVSQAQQPAAAAVAQLCRQFEEAGGGVPSAGALLQSVGHAIPTEDGQQGACRSCDGETGATAGSRVQGAHALRAVLQAYAT